MKYTIPSIPPSLNKFAGRQNHWEYRSAKQAWKELSLVYLRPKPKKPLDKAVVTITYFFGDKRKRDLDNLVKFVTDGMVAAGLIIDDSYQHIELVLRGDVDKENPRTEIEVKEIG